MPRLTDAQRRDRSSYLGATDVAALAGVDPYRTPFDVYLEKIGELDPEERQSQGDRDRRERGHRLEDVCLDWYAENEGVKLERVRRDVQHPALPFVVVHPDARVRPWRSTRRLVEAKTAARRWDELPRRVEAQVTVQMAAAGAESATVAVLGFDGPPVPWEVERNPELVEALEGIAAASWDRIQRRDPPPFGGSPAESRWLDKLFQEGPEFRADAAQADAIARLLAIREQMKALEDEDGRIVSALKWSMAGASRMFAPGVGRIVWTAPFQARSTSWKQVASSIRGVLEAVRAIYPDTLAGILAQNLGTTDLDEIESLYTSVEERRQFRVYPPKEKPE